MNKSEDNMFAANHTSRKRKLHDNYENYPTYPMAPVENNYYPVQQYNSQEQKIGGYSNSAVSPHSPAVLTPARMAEYLKNRDRYDCVLTIIHAKVAQKSYGKEKRFLRPPPIVSLAGDGWKEKRRQIQAHLQSAVKRSTDDFMRDRLMQECAGELCAFIGIGSPSEQRLLEIGEDKDFCPADFLFISDTDKRKYFQLSIQLFYASPMIEIGLFTSGRIKVISKPSSKKQSIKNADCKYLCIPSGTLVALFNKNGTQNAKNRYLHFDNGFQASSKQWGAFYIYLCDEHQYGDSFPIDEGFVFYGSIVKFVDSASGNSLPKFRIRKVDKKKNKQQMVVSLDDMAGDEPVSQFNSCAFQLVDNELEYLSICKDQIAMHTATAIDASHHFICEDAVWTILTADKTEFRFYEALGQVSQPVSPVPVAEQMYTTGADNLSRATVNGNNFKHDLTIWFGATAVETAFMSENSLTCMIPNWATVSKDLQNDWDPVDDKQVPISLVREDGVIYSTDLTFSYKNLCKE